MITTSIFDKDYFSKHNMQDLILESATNIDQKNAYIMKMKEIDNYIDNLNPSPSK